MWGLLKPKMPSKIRYTKRNGKISSQLGGFERASAIARGDALFKKRYASCNPKHVRVN